MSIARDILAFFGVNAFRRDTHESSKADLHPKYSKRQITKSWGQAFEQAAEVDDLKQRYSPMAYIEHLKASMEGNETGRGEWSRVLTNMSHADAAEFWFEFDELVDRGSWVRVLSAEEREQVKERVLEKVDEWRERSSTLTKDYGVPAALMHALNNMKTCESALEAFRLESEALEDEDLAAWAEDDEEADVGLGEER